MMNAGAQRLMMKKSHGQIEEPLEMMPSHGPGVLSKPYEEQLVTPESVVPESKPDQETSEYLTGLAAQENNELLSAPDDTIIMPNKPPEKSDTMDIGFGHKITPEEKRKGEIHGIPFDQGVTKAQALEILQQDIEKHKERARKSVGKKFDNLPQAAQEALVDMSFTGVLSKFPSFKKAIVAGDYAKARKESERSYTTPDGKRKKMDRRNEFMGSILDRLEG